MSDDKKQTPANSEPEVKDEVQWTYENQTSAAAQTMTEFVTRVDRLVALIGSYGSNMDDEVLGDIVDISREISDSLNEFADFSEQGLPEVIPMKCLYKFKSGKKKGEECGRLDCKTHG